MNAESTPTQSLNSPLSHFSAVRVIFIAVHDVAMTGTAASAEAAKEAG
jgi:hypothetical protein